MRAGFSAAMGLRESDQGAYFESMREVGISLTAQVSVLAVVLLCALGTAAQQGRPWVWIPEEPCLANPEAMECHPDQDSKVFTFPVGCYDLTLGKWKDCEVLFMEYFSLEGMADSERLLWTGGHDHTRASGNLPQTLGFLLCAVDVGGGSDPTMFYGHTGQQKWYARKTIPEASGVVQMMGRYRVENTRFQFQEDDTWRLDPTDPSGRTVYTEVAFQVGVQGLEVLPDSGDYEKISNHAGHLEPVFCGTPQLIQKLQKLAAEYRKITKQKVSFNDLSLRYGGLYDVNAGWECPHELHREGKSADVNRTVSKQQLTDLAIDLGFTECHSDSSLIHLELGPCKKKRS